MTSYLFMWETWAIAGALIAALIVTIWFQAFWQLVPEAFRKPLIAAAGGAILVLIGRLAGKKSAAADQAKRDAQAVNTRRKIDESVAKASDPDVSRRLNDWMRDD